MRFEHAAAWAMGIGLPLLETLRRRTHFEHPSSYVDDFIAGGLLLWAAHASSRGKPSGPVLLVMAWGVLAGGLYNSFFWQLESDLSHDVSGLRTGIVVAVKGVLYAITLVALALSVRSAVRAQRAG